MYRLVVQEKRPLWDACHCAARCRNVFVQCYCERQFVWCKKNHVVDKQPSTARVVVYEWSLRERQASFEGRSVEAKGIGVNVDQRWEGGQVHHRVGSACTLECIGFYSLQCAKAAHNAQCSRHVAKRRKLNADQRCKLLPFQSNSARIIFEFFARDARHLPPRSCIARCVHFLRQTRASIIAHIGFCRRGPTDKHAAEDQMAVLRRNSRKSSRWVSPGPTRWRARVQVISAAMRHLALLCSSSFRSRSCCFVWLLVALDSEKLLAGC